MKIRRTSSESISQYDQIFLAIDTCGPSGSAAVGRLGDGQSIEILGQIELEGRSYSTTLVAAVGDLLAQNGLTPQQLGGIVAVHGPGSFTGVRVGLSAVKGFAEALQIPVWSVSRLQLLAAKADVSSSAIDAHRQELFLRIGEAESLAGILELKTLSSSPQIAVCDETAAELLQSAWPAVALFRVAAPNATDALEFAALHLLSIESADVALLDGHYLRRSDAEIFGETARPQNP